MRRHIFAYFLGNFSAVLDVFSRVQRPAGFLKFIPKKKKKKKKKNCTSNIEGRELYFENFTKYTFNNRFRSGAYEQIFGNSI